MATKEISVCDLHALVHACMHAWTQPEKPALWSSLQNAGVESHHTFMHSSETVNRPLFFLSRTHKIIYIQKDSTKVWDPMAKIGHVYKHMHTGAKQAVN